MLINARTAIDGEACTLVPYCRHHVPVYHGWMQDPYVLEMTASEPLTLEEEYKMQKSWQEDGDKLTFIILDNARGGAMAGDVNLFFTIHNDDDDDDGEAGTGDEPASAPNAKRAAEIEVMVAEQGSRRKGLAREALRLMMAFAHRELGTSRFVAKILDSNQPSLRLFEAMGFTLLAREPDFEETHLVLDCGKGGGAQTQLARDVDALRVRDAHEAELGEEGGAGGGDGEPAAPPKAPEDP